MEETIKNALQACDDLEAVATAHGMTVAEFCRDWEKYMTHPEEHDEMIAFYRDATEDRATETKTATMTEGI